MSYYFCIVNTRDQPIFEHTFGTSKAGGDGHARFSPEALLMNPYLAHASLDFLDDLQFTNNAMYLKRIDHFASTHISAFLTPTSTRFLLLHLPHPPNTNPQSNAGPMSFPPFMPFTSAPGGGKAGGGGSSGTSVPNNPASPQAEEAVRLFFAEVFEVWIKAIMSPFQGVEDRIVSPVFKERVRGAGKKYL